MPVIPSIDLHPDAIPGNGPEAALLALRRFLDHCLSSGHREVRVITGLGARGDGTPRLRQRVESEVLPGYALRIEDQHYEQGGAVIRLRLNPAPARPDPRAMREREREAASFRLAEAEERLELCWQRLEAAKDYLAENELRKCRIKHNQIVRQLGLEELSGPADAKLLGARLAQAEVRLRDLDR